MQAKLLVRQRVEISETAFAELVIWQLPQAMDGSTHLFKYRLAYVTRGVCVLRYDNEKGKGDHRHYLDVESTYLFSNPSKLAADFFQDIERYRHEHPDH